jgi:hypothetical protein
MAEDNRESDVEHVIVAAIEHHAPADPGAMAKQIIAELRLAGRFIVPRDPTDKMNTAVAKSRDQGHWGLDCAWRAMVDAAQ